MAVRNSSARRDEPPRRQDEPSLRRDERRYEEPSRHYGEPQRRHLDEPSHYGPRDGIYSLRLRQPRAGAPAPRLHGQRSTDAACGRAILARARACAASTQGRSRWAYAEWTRDLEGTQHPHELLCLSATHSASLEKLRGVLNLPLSVHDPAKYYSAPITYVYLPRAAAGPGGICNVATLSSQPSTRRAGEGRQG